MPQPTAFYVDVDDTLVRYAGTKRIPLPNVILHVRSLKAEGATIYCWSTGGAEYAKRVAEDLGIADCFAAFLPKPNVIIDDQKVSDWKRMIVLHPLEISNDSIEDYRKKLDD
jgi:predicted HAD superfamily phosphohydrolase YqeG